MDCVNCNPYGAIQSLHVVVCGISPDEDFVYFFFVSLACKIYLIIDC